MLQRMLAALLAVMLLDASQAADTPAAEFTRSKRLAAKITLSAKEKPLKAVFDEISDQLEAKKYGRLRFEIAPAVSSLVPSTVNLDVKDQPLSAVLTTLLNPAGLGYVVVSSETDAKDGWIRIVKSDGKAPEPPKGPPATADEEKDAKLKLDTAKQAIKDGKPGDAKFLLTFIVKKYPTSAVAAEAKTLLESLKP